MATIGTPQDTPRFINQHVDPRVIDTDEEYLAYTQPNVKTANVLGMQFSRDDIARMVANNFDLVYDRYKINPKFKLEAMDEIFRAMNDENEVNFLLSGKIEKPEFDVDGANKNLFGRLRHGRKETKSGKVLDTGKSIGLFILGDILRNGMTDPGLKKVDYGTYTGMTGDRVNSYIDAVTLKGDDGWYGGKDVWGEEGNDKLKGDAARQAAFYDKANKEAARFAEEELSRFRNFRARNPKAAYSSNIGASPEEYEAKLQRLVDLGRTQGTSYTDILGTASNLGWDLSQLYKHKSFKKEAADEGKGSGDETKPETPEVKPETPEVKPETPETLPVNPLYWDSAWDYDLEVLPGVAKQWGIGGFDKIGEGNYDIKRSGKVTTLNESRPWGGSKHSIKWGDKWWDVRLGHQYDAQGNVTPGKTWAAWSNKDVADKHNKAITAGGYKYAGIKYAKNLNGEFKIYHVFKNDKGEVYHAAAEESPVPSHKKGGVIKGLFGLTGLQIQSPFSFNPLGTPDLAQGLQVAALNPQQLIANQLYLISLDEEDAKPLTNQDGTPVAQHTDAELAQKFALADAAGTEKADDSGNSRVNQFGAKVKTYTQDTGFHSGVNALRFAKYFNSKAAIDKMKGPEKPIAQSALLLSAPRMSQDLQSTNALNQSMSQARALNKANMSSDMSRNMQSQLAVNAADLSGRLLIAALNSASLEKQQELQQAVSAQNAKSAWSAAEANKQAGYEYGKEKILDANTKTKLHHDNNEGILDEFLGDEDARSKLARDVMSNAVSLEDAEGASAHSAYLTMMADPSFKSNMNLYQMIIAKGVDTSKTPEEQELQRQLIRQAQDKLDYIKDLLKQSINYQQNKSKREFDFASGRGYWGERFYNSRNPNIGRFNETHQVQKTRTTLGGDLEVFNDQTQKWEPKKTTSNQLGGRITHMTLIQDALNQLKNLRDGSTRE